MANNENYHKEVVGLKAKVKAVEAKLNEANDKVTKVQDQLS
jgi:hypothetical protein